MSARLESPWERWSRDPRALSHLTEEDLRRAFVTYLWRTVSKDGAVPIDNTGYEVPRDIGPSGRRGARVQITHRLIEGGYYVPDANGQLVRIWPVDLAANARAPRARRGAAAEQETTTAPPAKTAADLHFESELGPVIDEEGNALPPSGLAGEWTNNPDAEEI